MAIKKLVSCKNAVYEAVGDMGIDFTKDNPIMTRWAATAARKIGSYYSYTRKIFVIDVANCQAELPCCAIAVKGVLEGDWGCDCDNLFSSAYSLISSGSTSSSTVVNSTFLVVDVGSCLCSCSGIRYEIQDNRLIFKNKPGLTKVTVQLLVLEEDCDGFPMVSENSIEAISTYIMWKFAERSQFRKGNQISVQYVRELNERFSYLSKQAIAEDAGSNPSEYEEIVSMLNDPIVGHGVFLNNYY